MSYFSFDDLYYWNQGGSNDHVMILLLIALLAEDNQFIYTEDNQFIYV